VKILARKKVRKALHPSAPKDATHPNRVRFRGVLTWVDVPSDRAPSGARGHRVVLTLAAAQAARKSLLGMAVDYKAGWDGHDARQKCGVIDTARIVGHELQVEGYLFGRDFPDVVETARRGGTAKDALGMSYELIDAHVADMRAEVWRLTRVTFSGAAILLAGRAAYRKTSFRLAPEADNLALAAAGGVELRSIVPDEDKSEEDGEAREEGC
jgi:hypothetical protein